MSSTFFTIENPNGIWYALFYFLAFLTALTILIVEGKRRQFPMVPWLLVISTSFLFFIIGTQAIKFTHDDWVAVIALKNIDHDPGRSVLGGILLGTIGLLLAKYFFKFKFDVVDTFARVAPVGMIIQRNGCVLTGCCYGTTTKMPWGVTYGSSSRAFAHQVSNHIIDITRNIALPVHPVPLYEIAGCIIIISILVVIRKKIFVSGNLFFAMLVLYGIVRFVTEFFRAESFGDEMTEGLNTVQYVLLVAIPLLSAWIIWREENRNVQLTVARSVTQPSWRSLIYFIIISIAFLFVSRWLSTLEIMTLNLVMLPNLVLITWLVFKAVTVPRMRVVTGSMMACSLLLMSQTLPEKPSNDSTKTSYNVLSFGLSGGSIDFNRIYTITGPTGCNGSGPTKVNDELQSNNSVFGAGYTRVLKRKSKTFQYGADFYAGSTDESYTNSQGTNRAEVTNHVSIAGFHPYIQYDGRDVGVGVGLHAGSLVLPQLPDDGSGNPTTTSVHKISVFPSLYLRLGHLNGFFWENKIGQQFPAPFPGLGYQTSFGIGLRTKKLGNSSLRFGTASFVGFFVAPSFSIDNVIVEPYMGGGPGIFNGTSWGGNYSEISQKASFQAALSIRVKFGRKEMSLK